MDDRAPTPDDCLPIKPKPEPIKDSTSMATLSTFVHAHPGHTAPSVLAQALELARQCEELLHRECQHSPMALQYQLARGLALTLIDALEMLPSRLER
jgi:hypothetical protein